MNEREYKRLRAQAEREYREKIQALEVVWKMAQTQRTERNGARTERGAGKGEVRQGTREAITNMHGKFTLRDVERWLSNNKPELVGTKRTTISGTLKRLVGAEIEIVEKGKGKRATIYRRLEKAKGAVAA